MSLRIKAAWVIMAIVFAITVAYFFLSISLTNQKLFQAMEQDLALVVAIADDLVTAKINLLRSDAFTMVERLLKAPSVEEMVKLMELQMEEFDDFTSLTVYDKNGIIANWGEPIAHDVFKTENHYIQIAFEGGSVFSTTHYNNVSGAFIMHVFVPMGEHMVLSATFPGMLFSDLLAGYRLWLTGNIFMIDETGAVIANYRREMVLNRRNFIEEAKTNPQEQNIANFSQQMLAHDSGMGTYILDGVNHLSMYERVKGSRSGWRIAVAVPLNESPLTTLRRGLILSSLIFLAVGALVAIHISGRVVRPFYKIEEQNKNLEELNEVAMAANEAKSSFLAMMSHEMRTPLNAIIGLSELALETGQYSDEDSSNLEKIYNAGATLLSTVNDILDISKIEAGKFELVTTDYDTPSILNDTITQSMMRIGEKPIKFILQIDENLPSRLNGDDLRVKQIMNNFLSNAFKYTKEGTVELSVKCERDKSSADNIVWMNVRVSDTGKGIRPEDMDKLFGNYSQMDTKVNHHIEGTGLGLSITKKMVKMMGGAITVESEYGKGSVFTARFQQKFVTDVVIGSNVANSLKSFHFSDDKRRHGLQRKRLNLSYAKVLVVDDVQTNLDVARGMMKPYGMQIDCVLSGQEAIDAIRDGNVKYSAVFMDHMMPGMDGIEATRIIREEIGTEYAKTVPIIALTANAIVGNEQLFLSKGFQAFLSKPIEIARLDATVREFVRDTELEKTLVNQRIDVDGEMVLDKRSGKERRVAERRSGFDRRIFGKGISGLNIGKGLERFGGDNETYVQVLRSFTANTPPLLETAKKVNKENLADYAIVVHGLKSSCRGICAENTGSQAEALEKASKAGDFDFVMAHNTEFIEAAEKLVADLDGLLRQMVSEEKKPKKDKPDSETLKKLLTACNTLDIDGVDAIMKELEAWDYESDNGLVAWLRENADQINFGEMTEKLSALEESET